ncbi:excalibur calcium-binding domain-containing protein [Glutamicibacter endophyticus]|uniref:excalibur calcium-binding domain-containing protein n=1 Tax=Glutamicibacter endophyticus TaxID=1522174 RepID=UPI003AF10CCE
MSFYERPPSSQGNRRKTLYVILAVLALALLIWLPGLLLFLAFVGLILAIIGWSKGRIPGLKIANRRGIKIFGASAAGLLVASLVSGGIQAPTEVEPTAQDNPISISTESPTPSPSASPSLEDFEGESCEGDDLVMDQDDKSLYCDKNDAGNLVWLSETDHDAVILAAEKKAAEEKKAKEEAAAKKLAAEKAAEEKAAAEKKVAEKKAAEKAAAKLRAVEQAAAAKAAEEAAAKEAAARAQEEKASANVYYKNCTAVRAAGAAPIYKGEPGYSRKLDRDGDGVGCE